MIIFSKAVTKKIEWFRAWYFTKLHRLKCISYITQFLFKKKLTCFYLNSAIQLRKTQHTTVSSKYERPTLTMSHDLLPIAPLTGQFAVNFYLIGAEIIASCPHVIVAVWNVVRAARETRIIVSICIVCNVNIMSWTEGRTIIVIVVCSVITIGNVPFKISRSLIVFERKYEGFWWINVASVPWKKAHKVDKNYPLI